MLPCARCSLGESGRGGAAGTAGLASRSVARAWRVVPPTAPPLSAPNRRCSTSSLPAALLGSLHFLERRERPGGGWICNGKVRGGGSWPCSWCGRDCGLPLADHQRSHLLHRVWVWGKWRTGLPAGAPAGVRARAPLPGNTSGPQPHLQPSAPAVTVPMTADPSGHHPGPGPP